MVDFQVIQFQPRQPRLELSGSRYGEPYPGIGEAGGVTVRIAKLDCSAFCHVPPPVRPADSSCDPFKCSYSRGSIKQLTSFDYAGSEVRQLV
jgi:hypothetical protein